MNDAQLRDINDLMRELERTRNYKYRIRGPRPESNDDTSTVSHVMVRGYSAGESHQVPSTEDGYGPGAFADSVRRTVQEALWEFLVREERRLLRELKKRGMHPDAGHESPVPESPPPPKRVKGPAEDAQRKIEV